MSAQPAPTRKPRAKKSAKSKKSTRFLSVRMYDVGFGDCYLLTIPVADGQNLKILFDCGSIKLGAHSESMRKVVQHVIDDLRDDPAKAPHVDVVVATHRHRDHILGFDDQAWSAVEVGEVWMPWTEKPGDPIALKLRTQQMRMAEHLVSRLEKALRAAPNDKMLQLGSYLALNALTNDGAVRTLQTGFVGEPLRRYLAEEDPTASWFTTPVLPGVTIHVLGPSHDESVINEMDPPLGESYLKMMETGSDDLAEHPLPFNQDWTITAADYAADYGELDRDLPSDRRDQIRLASSGGDDAMAMVLDKALNGTSLVLVIQVGNAMLLFPGDAQWGTWRLALANHADLLKSVTFYKVGHHGSHNATPRDFVDQYLGASGQPVQLMISVNPTDNWPSVPKQELLDAFQQKKGCKVARSDKPAEAAAAGFTLIGENVIEAKIPF
jgi:beta-lactamase superfamily II metal-dependent hydrolase